MERLPCFLFRPTVGFGVEPKRLFRRRTGGPVCRNPLCHRLFQLGMFGLVCDVLPFVRIGIVIVEFFAAIVVPDVAEAF